MRDFLALSKRDFEDYEFILNDMLRFAQMAPLDLKAHYEKHPEDRMRFAPRPGGGTLLVSHAVDERFWRIVERGCGCLGSEGKKYSQATIVNLLKAELVRRYSDNPDGITDENAHQVFEDVVKSLAQTHKELEHFIPCAVVANFQPRQFCIGPVEFIVMDDFLAHNGDAMRDEISTKIKTFFCQFKWVARVKIAAASRTVSSEKARSAVRNALNLLKLFLGAEYAGGVRDGYSAGEPHHVTELIRDTERFHALSGWKMQDAVVGDDWLSFLSNLDAWKIGESIIGIQAESWDYLPEPRQRFLDALSWHGDAVAEPDPRARILKLWASIERIVSTDVKRRAAMLASNNPEQFEQIRKGCERLYGIRSSIIHGSRSRPSATIYRDALKTEELSRTVLVHYLYVIHNLADTGTRADLEKEFQRLEQLVKPNRTRKRGR